MPAFVVQTLVENAVKHGLERTREGGEVSIRCQSTEDGIRIQVVDTGVGIPSLFGTESHRDADTFSFFGIGLSNISSRLEYLYRRDDLLSIRSASGAGTTVTVLIPNGEPAVPRDDAAAEINQPEI